MSQWISVDKELPRADIDSVLAMVKSYKGEINVYEAFIDSKDGWKICTPEESVATSEYGMEVIAWMPIPE